MASSRTGAPSPTGHGRRAAPDLSGHRRFRIRPERRWTYRTASRSGEMWGLGFDFAEQPTDVAEFTRDGTRIRATGSGTVTITGARGCRFTAELPFARRLPGGC